MNNEGGLPLIIYDAKAYDEKKMYFYFNYNSISYFLIGRRKIGIN